MSRQEKNCNECIRDGAPSLAHGLVDEPRLISGRESHTSNLDEFDRYMFRLLADRARGGRSDSAGEKGDHKPAPYHEAFWKHIRSALERTSEPLGYAELSNAEDVTPVGPEMGRKFMERIRNLADLTPVHPANLAGSTGVDHDTVLEELLRATAVGMVEMRWAPECARCGCAVVLESELGALPPEAPCEVCGFHNEIDSLDGVMVVFLLNQDVLYLPSAHPFGCRISRRAAASAALAAPVPATSTGSGFRYSVGCDGSDSVRPALPPGRYRLACPYSGRDFTLQVKSGSGAWGGYQGVPCRCQLTASELMSRPLGEKRPSSRTIRLPHGRVQFDVYPDTRSFFFVTIFPDDPIDDDVYDMPKDERVKHTSATQVMHHSVFQELFSDQVVRDRPGTDFPLAFSQVVVAVVDIPRPAELCAVLGDGPALRVVQSFFDVVTRAFKKRGRLVRKVDCSAMGSFTNGRGAIESVLDVMLSARGLDVRPRQMPLGVRAAIHCGPTVIVPLNGINDYFGKTVSVTESIKELARPNECLVSDKALHSEPDTVVAFRTATNGSHFQLSREFTFEVCGSSPAADEKLYGLRARDGGKLEKRLAGKKSVKESLDTATRQEHDSGVVTFLRRTKHLAHTSKNSKSNDHQSGVFSFLREGLSNELEEPAASLRHPLGSKKVKGPAAA